MKAAVKPAPLTLFSWPPSRGGRPDRCDHCGGKGELWSVELAGDEPVLCRACWQALAAAIGAALGDEE